MILLPLLIVALALGITVQLIDPDSYIDAFEYVIKFLISVLDLILAPFNFLISNYMPAMDDAMLQIAEYFNYANTYMSWVFDAFAVPSLAVTLAASYYMAVFMITLGVSSFKLLLKWKRSLF